MYNFSYFDPYETKNNIKIFIFLLIGKGYRFLAFSILA